MTKTEMILIRHGETIWNAEGRIQGQGDSPLTERGIAQARAVARRLQEEAFTTLYGSHLGRVIETARHIADVTGHAITIDERLQERHYGIFEGLTYAEAQTQHPDIFATYQQLRYTADYAHPGAESLRQLTERGQAVFQALAERHAGERLVIVSHGALIGAMLRHFLGVPIDGKHGFRLANGSLSEVVFADSDWRVRTLGEVYHLRDLEVL
ncbi:MAG: histidine phosphatase family protein [Caldilineaceae bacterium]